MYLEVIDASFEITGQDSNRNPVGLVTIELSNGAIGQFEDVDALDVEEWQATGFDLDNPPHDMELLLAGWLRSFDAPRNNEEESDEDDEDIEEDEQEDEEEDIVTAWSRVLGASF